MQFDRAGTTLVAERRDGDGPPLVVVPGMMADAASWRPVTDHLAAPGPVVVLNRRGRAHSGPLGEGYSVRTEIDDLHHVLDPSASPHGCSAGATVDSSRWRPPWSGRTCCP